MGKDNEFYKLPPIKTLGEVLEDILDKNLEAFGDGNESAAVSPRSIEEAVKEICELFQDTKIIFDTLSPVDSKFFNGSEAFKYNIGDLVELKSGHAVVIDFVDDTDHRDFLDNRGFFQYVNAEGRRPGRPELLHSYWNYNEELIVKVHGNIYRDGWSILDSWKDEFFVENLWREFYERLQNCLFTHRGLEFEDIYPELSQEFQIKKI